MQIHFSLFGSGLFLLSSSPAVAFLFPLGTISAFCHPVLQMKSFQNLCGFCGFILKAKLQIHLSLWGVSSCLAVAILQNLKFSSTSLFWVVGSSFCHPVLQLQSLLNLKCRSTFLFLVV